MSVDLTATYAAMLRELQMKTLDVGLAPSCVPEVALRGGMVRVVNSENPAWYRDLCSDYASSRKRKTFKSDTKVKRARIKALLAQLARGTLPSSRYAPDLQTYAERILAGDYDEYGDVY